MRKRKVKALKALFTTTLLVSASNLVHAALYDRGNGMIYDSDLNITWLQDANYAQTSGYSATGQMTWDQAKNWAANLVYDNYDGWRLASAKPLSPPGYGYQQSTDGSTDVGFYNSRSEIGHLYNELGNLYAGSFNDDPTAAGLGFLNTTYSDGGSPPIKFLNVAAPNSIPGIFWEDESFTDNYGYLGKFWFRADIGYQGFSTGFYYCGPSTPCTLEGQAWAVHDGDIANVSSVPIPASALLFISGLIGLMSTKHKNIGALAAVRKTIIFARIK